MNCPVCGRPMEEGGIIAAGTTMWHPLKEFQKHGLKKLWYKHGKMIGTNNILLHESKLANAWYCASCNKVAGVFDVIDFD